MDLASTLLDLFLHLDTHLQSVLDLFGVWTYVIVFLVIFCETGLVVAPFLPGDSLLFAVGTLAARGTLDIRVLALLLCIAAILGDSTNYAIGARIGPAIFRSDTGRFLNKEYLERTRLFFDAHGRKTIMIARFLPIIRTFAPFVAGIGRMHYPTFLSYNVIGGIAWVLSFLYGGYFFGNIPAVQENFSLVIVGIVGMSLVPTILEYLHHRNSSR